MASFIAFIFNMVTTFVGCLLILRTYIFYQRLSIFDPVARLAWFGTNWLVVPVFRGFGFYHGRGGGDCDPSGDRVAGQLAGGSALRGLFASALGVGACPLGHNYFCDPVMASAFVAGLRDGVAPDESDFGADFQSSSPFGWL